VLPHDDRGRILWSIFKDDPEALKLVIENEARAFLSAGNRLTYRNLQQTAYGLKMAIHKYYPGGIPALKENLGIRTRRPYGSGKDPEIIEREAIEFFQREGGLSGPLLKSREIADLLRAIKNYPGGIRRLQTLVKIEQTSKPAGFWNPEKVEEEARAFFQNEGTLTRRMLRRKNRQDLDAAIERYGGMISLKKRLGIGTRREKPQNYWQDAETIRHEVQRFTEGGGILTQRNLSRAGLSSLDWAIRNYYPGGIQQLRLDLGLEASKYPPNYWTIERIEEEAKKVFEQEGGLTAQLLKEHNKRLYRVIAEKYPGGLAAINEKLGANEVDSVEELLNQYEGALQKRPMSFREFLQEKK